MRLDYLVTGTGRCGTVHLARLLTSLGIPCGHEAVFKPGGISAARVAARYQSPPSSHCSGHDVLHDRPIRRWMPHGQELRADSSYMAAPFLADPLLGETKVVHLVRHPLKVISSFVKDIRFFDPDNRTEAVWRKFIMAHLPGLEAYADPVEKTCQYYIQWNKLIESGLPPSRSMRHRVEDGLSDKLADFLGVPADTEHFTDPTINSWRKRDSDLSLSDLPLGETKRQFTEVCEKYGYQVRHRLM